MPTPETCSHYANAILDRHSETGSEADIGHAIRDFLTNTGLVASDEIEMEQSPGDGSLGRVDLRTRDVIVEFKKRIGDRLLPMAKNLEQIDGYLEEAQAGRQP